MINLIPKEEKKKMIVDFYYRLFVLFLFMLSFAIFIGVISLLPAYFYSSEKNSIVNTELATQKNTAVPLLGEQSLAAVSDINNKLGIINNAEKNSFPISEKVINTILAEKTSDIHIIQITYQNDPVLGKQVGVLGIADTREALLSFQQTLASDPDFKNVNLPISSFVKDSNIQFNLTLNPS